MLTWRSRCARTSVQAVDGATETAVALHYHRVHALSCRCQGGGEAGRARDGNRDGDYDALHFETCYHQGIEYCIDHGLRLFEPGTQGEHKVARGFVPTATWSAHWLKHPEFFAVIGDYLERERQHVERYMDAVDERSPYKSPDPT
mgnify:CR=1 FL=1